MRLIKYCKRNPLFLLVASINFSLILYAMKSSYSRDIYLFLSSRKVLPLPDISLELSSKFELAISRERQLGFPTGREFPRCRYMQQLHFHFHVSGTDDAKFLHTFSASRRSSSVSSRISLRGFLRYLGTNLRGIVPINRETHRENHFTPQQPQDESGPTKPTRPDS